MRCERPRCAAAQRVLRPTNEYEYDGVWNEACATVLSVFPITTGALPHQFHPYINQQDSVLDPFHDALLDRRRTGRDRAATALMLLCALGALYAFVASVGDVLSAAASW